MRKHLPVGILLVSTLMSCGTNTPPSKILAESNVEQQNATFEGSIIYVEWTASASAKQAIRSQAGHTLHLAIAMQEDKTLDATKYPFGDVYPDGTQKTGNAANFGLYKMNWYMISRALKSMWPTDPTFSNLGPNDYTKYWPGSTVRIADRINRDPAMATRILNAAFKLWSIAEPRPGVSNNFWAGHRCGETGLLRGESCVAGKSFDDVIGKYYRGVTKLRKFLNTDGLDRSKYGDYWTNSVRFGLDIYAI